ncbi:MAG: LCP family protein [Candidatus Eremiobacteraeota bacterium]|nr:LCP family protein [Candidatus Eremiobacteraeota bacterium]
MGRHLDPGAPRPLNANPATMPAFRRIALIVGLLLVGIGAVFAGFAIFEHENPFQMLSQTFVPSPVQLFGKSNILVLVEGLDYDYTANDIEFSTNSRSDMIKAINLDFTHKNIYVVTVLRDMLATFPNGSKHKINQAQSDGGVKEASTVIARFLGVPGFDRYAVLRVDASKDIIDALGGVDVYIKSSDCLQGIIKCGQGRIDYDDSWGHLHIHFQEGMHHLTGDQAVSYGRFRHDWCSDPCRIKRQNQVMLAVVDRIKNDKLNTVLNAGTLLKVVRKDIDTNFTDSELLSLASYFSGDLTKDSLHFDAVPYTGDIELSDGDDLIADEAAKSKIVQSMLVAPPTPVPSPDAMALAGIAPATLRVDVKNASGVKGAAHVVAAMLERDGYTIGSIGNADAANSDRTQITEHSKVVWAGAKVRTALPLLLQQAPITAAGTDGTAATASPSDVTVVIGKDLAAVVTAASPNPKAT